jgi:hypothetical protein
MYNASTDIKQKFSPKAKPLIYAKRDSLNRKKLVIRQRKHRIKSLIVQERNLYVLNPKGTQVMQGSPPRYANAQNENVPHPLFRKEK